MVSKRLVLFGHGEKRVVRRKRISNALLGVESLEDRLLMSVSDSEGPTFERGPSNPDPGTTVGEATIRALNDAYSARVPSGRIVLNVLGNDGDSASRSSLRIKEVSATSLGSVVSISEDGTRLSYTPHGNQTGKDSFFYIVEDSEGNLGKANVMVNLLPPLGPRLPMPGNDYFDLTEDDEDVSLDVLANDDASQQLVITKVGAPSQGGQVRIAEDGRSLIYTPGSDVRGFERFSYTVTYANGREGMAWVRVSVQRWFKANSDFFEFDVNSPTIELDVLQNDANNLPPESPRIVDVEQPDAGGTITISEDGQRLLYQPAAGFLGRENIVYTVRYGPKDHHVSSASVRIDVVDPYLAVDDWFRVDKNALDARLDVLANDPILAGRYKELSADRTLRIVEVSTPEDGGQVEIIENGEALSFRPEPSFIGDVTLTYTTVDNTGHRDSASVIVHVAEPIVDPFNLPRFSDSGELAQYLLDEAVDRWKRVFGTRYQSYTTFVGSFSSDFIGLTPSFADTTNTQVNGVDEADFMETDGSFVYTFSDGRFVIIDVRDLSAPKVMSAMPLEHGASEMYLRGDRVTLISRGHQGMVTVLDVSDRAAPHVVLRTEIDGQITDTRAIGDLVHVVTRQRVTLPPLESHLIETSSEDGNSTREERVYETLDQYVARVKAELIELSLPMFRSYDGEGELVRSGILAEATQIHKPISPNDRQLLTIATFDMSSDDAGVASATALFTGGANSIYVSHSSVYVLRREWLPYDITLDYDVPQQIEQTRILQFEFQADGSTSLEAHGTVSGYTLNQFSLDEYDGTLRVATTERIRNRRGTLLSTENHLFTLQRQGTELQIVGSIEHLAPTERIYSVRFMGDRAYVVTFRQVDPLFAIDLSDPTSPQVEGQLKIPGFSNYLHPVGEEYLIGFGRDADAITGQLLAPQVSLFYVGDLENPRLVDRLTMRGAQFIQSEAFVDHHAIAYFDDYQILSIPIGWREEIEIDTDGDGQGDRLSFKQRSAAWVFQIDVDQADGSLEFLTHIDHDSSVRRSTNISDALITVSDQHLKVNDISNPQEQRAEVYIGRLPQNDSFVLDEDSEANVLDVLANDRLENVADFRIVEVSQPAKDGMVEIADDGRSLIFTPAKDFFGVISFRYTLWTESRGEEQANVTIQVSNVPDDPVAVDDEFDFEVDPGQVKLDVLKNDENPDFIPRTPVFHASVNMVSLSALTDSFAPIDVIFPGPIGFKGLTITEISPTDHGGHVEIDARGLFVLYTPSEGFEGVETFHYTISTTTGQTSVATVTVVVGETVEQIQVPAAQTEPVVFSAPGVIMPLTATPLPTTSTTVSIVLADRPALLEAMWAANLVPESFSLGGAQSASAFHPSPATDPSLTPEDAPADLVEWHHGQRETKPYEAEVWTDRHKAAMDRGEIDTLATSLHVRWQEHIWDDALLNLIGQPTRR